jgi:hypothetical protein
MILKGDFFRRETVDDEGGKERMTGDGYDRNVSYMHVKIAW